MTSSLNESNNAVLVIGGGIAGIQASLDLAKLGFKTYLVEKRPNVGGKVTQLDKLYPTMEDSLYYLAPLFGDLLENPNIELFTYSEVTSVTGSAGNFKITILKYPRFVDETKCDACDTCATVCPMVTVDNDFNVGLGRRKAAYTPFTQAVPKTYVIDKDICLYFNANKMCKSCQILCPKSAIDFDQKPVEIQVDVNAIIIAAGVSRHDDSILSKFGYDFENVLTALEFERILTPNGPTEGQIIRISDRKTPESIAFITLDSSASQKAGAIKQAIRVKEKNPNIDCFVLMNGTLEDEVFAKFIKRSIEDGVSYIDGRITAVNEDPDNKDLVIQYKDNTKEANEIKVNTVVLFDKLFPSEAMTQLASVLCLKLNKNGFFAKKSKSEPLETKKPGIFVIGDDLQQESIMAARADVNAVVSKIVSQFAPPELWTPKAFVETEYCIGCGTCREVCPFYAISLQVVELELPVAEVAGIPLKTRKAQVHESLCRGCGICPAECPVQAIRYGDPETLE
ncbi:MAG: 4Fe-4S binding protein, partial [Promethearchaeota archaeon]